MNSTVVVSACIGVALFASIFVVLPTVTHDESQSSSVDSPNQDQDPSRARAQRELQAWRRVEDFSGDIAQFETVFWEPDDTISLRQLIRETPIVRDKAVLEIGTGTGLVSLCCLQAGAKEVVATDINEAAVENALFNAQLLDLADRLEVSRVSLDNRGAFAVIEPSEQFDLIISNPPWENDRPDKIDDFALFDEDFALMRSLIEDLDRHLAPHGRALLAYGCVTAIQEIKLLAHEHGFTVRVLDERRLDELPDNFLPGMLLELQRVQPIAAEHLQDALGSPGFAPDD